MVQQRPVQGPARGEEQPQTPVHAEGQQAGNQLWEKGPRGPAGKQVDHKPAVYPCCKEGHII